MTALKGNASQSARSGNKPSFHAFFLSLADMLNWRKREGKMSNIIFWMALVILPVLAGTAFAYLRHMHHGDDF